MNEFLTFLAGLLGDDHELVTRLREVEPAQLDEIDQPEGMTDDERQALADFANVGDELLAEIRGAIIEAARSEDTPIETVEQAADYVVGLDYIASSWAASDDAEEAARQAALERMGVTDGSDDAGGDEPAGDEDGDDDDEGDDPGDGEPTGDEGTDGAEASDDEREPVMAGGGQPRPRPTSMARTRGRQAARTRPRPEQLGGPDGPTWRLIEPAGDRPAGPVTEDQLGVALLERARDLAGNHYGGPVKHRLARQTIEYPEEYRLTDSPTENGRRLAAIWEESQQLAADSSSPAEALQAVTASAWCTMATPMYEIAGVGDTERPLRSFYTFMDMSRGAVLIRKGRSIEDMAFVVDDDSSGVAIWTGTNDADPGSDGPATKPVLEVECLEPTEFEVAAITKRAQFSNFLERYDSENIADVLRLQAIFWTIVAERRIWNQVVALSKKIDAGTGQFGFARDLLNAWEAQAAGIRDRNRIADNTVLDVIVPHWVPNAVRADLRNEIPGAPVDRLRARLAEFDEMVRELGLRIGYARDVHGFASQPGDLDTPGDLTRFPDEVQWVMHENGHFFGGDGLNLDLGIVRDSALNDTNKAQTFMESSEVMVQAGVVSEAVTMDVCIRGASTGTIDPAEVDCQVTPGS